MTDSIPTTDCDVLIIGGGLAACMAALEASKRNMDVVLVDKGRLGRSGSSPTSGGVPQAAFAHADPRDSKDQHFRDTILGGDYIPNQKIVRAIVDEVTDRVIELEEMGLHFKKTPDGKQFYQEKRLGSSYARSCPPVGGSVGMLGSLRKEVFNREVQVHQWTMVTKLLRRNGRVTGALGINVQKGTTTPTAPAPWCWPPAAPSASRSTPAPTSSPPATPTWPPSTSARPWPTWSSWSSR